MRDPEVAAEFILKAKLLDDFVDDIAVIHIGALPGCGLSLERSERRLQSQM
jgi:hypothetical protein